jgi:hypothetical protein
MTQVHVIDPCAGMVLVIGTDGTRLLYGSQIGIGSTNEVLQRLFEVLEDGKINYYVHPGVETDGVVKVEEIAEFFPVDVCLELESTGDDVSPIYRNFRAERTVETLAPDDIYELGDTQIRVVGGSTPRSSGEGIVRPVALHVSHGEEPAGGAVLCPGAMNGLDWLELGEDVVQALQADCLVLDGRHPLDSILTSREKGLVSADPLRWIAPRTILLGQDPDGENKLRIASRELYGHIARQHPGGDGLVEMNNKAWLSLTLDGTRAEIVRESRVAGKAA